MSAFAKAALPLAERGWRVHPVHDMRRGRCSCGKTCDKPGKHPRTRHGYKDATANPDVIRAWESRYPDANVGVACRDSKLVGLDIDPRHGGHETWQDLVRDLGVPPETPTDTTGSGGNHYLHPDPGGKLVGTLGPGVDVKHNGYLVVPDSVTEGRYRWLISPDEMLPATLPETWIDRLRKPSPSASNPLSSSKNESRNIENGGVDNQMCTPQVQGTSWFLEGERWEELRSLAGKLRYYEAATHAELERALLQINATLCKPPAPKEQVQRIARDAMEIGRAWWKVEPVRAVWSLGIDDPADQAVLIALATSARLDGTVTGGRWLAERTGWSRNAITRSIKRLEQRGWIEVKRAPRQPNRYRLRGLPTAPVHIPRIEGS